MLLRWTLVFECFQLDKEFSSGVLEGSIQMLERRTLKLLRSTSEAIDRCSRVL